MLSTIAWTNRGTAGNDTDGLGALFGGNAQQARLLVDRAILDWEEVIVDFHQSGGGNNFALTVNTMDLDDSIADSGITGKNSGKPTAGFIRIDNVGTTHYIDPTAGDDAEFTTITNAFTGFAPGIVGTDFYATVLHELGHLLGFTTFGGLLIDNFLTDTGIQDPQTSDAGNLFALNLGGGPIEATITEADSSHLWEGPGNAQTNAAGLPWHKDVLMNSGRDIERNERNLISDLEATILRDVYGYTVTMPSTLNNMLVNPNFTTDVLTVIGQPGNVNDLIIVQGSAIPGALHVSVGTVGQPGSFSEIVPLSQTNTINVNSGDGNDIIRLEYNGGRTTNFNGGNGDDIFDFAFGTRNLNNITGPATLIGGNGFDRVFVYDNNGVNGVQNQYFVTSGGVSRFGWGGFAIGGGLDNIMLTTSTAADNVGVLSTSVPVVLQSAGGPENVSIGNSDHGLQDIMADVQVQNDPNFSSLSIIDAVNGTSRFGTIDQYPGNFGILAGLAPANIFWDRSDVNYISITTGYGNDALTVLRCSEELYLSSNGGDDTFTLGNGAQGMTAITQPVEIDGGFANADVTNLVVNNLGDTVGRFALVTASGDDYLLTGISPAAIRYRRVDGLTILGGDSGDRFTFLGAISHNITVVDDSGDDTVALIEFSNRFIDGVAIRQYNAYFELGGGINFLDVDGSDAFNTNYQLRPDEIRISQFFGIIGATVSFENISGGVTIRCSDDTNIVRVYGTAPVAPGYQHTILLNGGADTALLFPHDDAGNLTINGTLGIGGGDGADNFSIDDTASAAPIDYRFLNIVGAHTTNIDGLGTAGFGVGRDIETLTINAGGGADVFNIDHFSSGNALVINGGGGDDTVNFGVSDVITEITSMASFHYNGQADFDTFRFNNSSDPNGLSYYRTFGETVAYTGGNLAYAFTDAEIERYELNAGTAIDGLYVDSLDSGLRLVFNAGDGLDGLALGYNVSSLEEIHGPVEFNAGPGGGYFSVWDLVDTTGDVVHLDQNSLGAKPGDDLFGPGGSLSFAGVSNSDEGIGIYLNLGQGPDSVFARPHPAAAMSIKGGDPTAAPGDSLRLTLFGVTDPVFTPSGIGTGTYTFAIAASLAFAGFESAVAAYPGDFDLDGTVGPLDYDTWKAAFGTIVSPPGTSADANGDGIVNAADYTLWRNYQGFQFPQPGIGSSLVVQESRSTTLGAIDAIFESTAGAFGLNTTASVDMTAATNPSVGLYFGPSVSNGVARPPSERGTRLLDQRQLAQMNDRAFELLALEVHSNDAQTVRNVPFQPSASRNHFESVTFDALWSAFDRELNDFDRIAENGWA